jgi:3-oxoacyl-[acyl-carrier protein] reductase
MHSNGTMVILSGASGGIGKAIIPLLLKDYQVVGLYNKNRPDLPLSDNLFLERVDITDSTSVKSFVDKWKDKLGRMALVHGAVQSIDGLAVQYGEADWDRVIDVNLKGDFLLTKALLPLMVQNRWGRIIHVSSFAGVEGVPGIIGYAASKAGVLGLSRVLAKEYARFDVTSNVLKLGYFEAGLFHRLSEKIRSDILNKIPHGKLGGVENIAHAIRFLIQSDYVNGAVISIDGGM